MTRFERMLGKIKTHHKGANDMVKGDKVSTLDLLPRTGTVISTGSDLICVRWDEGGVTSYTGNEAEQELEVTGE